MLITFEDRASDLAVIDRVWRSSSEQAGRFQSMATGNWGVVVSRVQGHVQMTVRGPETVASVADCPAEGEWIGIHFKPGSFMPLLPPGLISDRRDAHLPQAGRRAFQLQGSTWEYPDFDNAEVFVRRLIAKGLIVTDPVTAAVIADAAAGLSRRTGQRRFLQATGMTQAKFRQIERARSATALLRDGKPIADVIHALGYYDQAHLTRALRHFVGQTPARIARQQEQLSLLYKTD